MQLFSPQLTRASRSTALKGPSAVRMEVGLSLGPHGLLAVTPSGNFCKWCEGHTSEYMMEFARICMLSSQEPTVKLCHYFKTVEKYCRATEIWQTGSGIVDIMW
jgi:hypothetical protein